MTLTAVGATPQRSPLPQPSPPEVLALQSVKEYPAISVLCTTEPAARMTSSDAARLEGLVDDALRRLREEFSSAVCAPLRERLEELLDDAGARPTRAAVALFVSSRHASSWSLPHGVVDRSVLDPTFATRDLVRALHRTPRHVVLVLTENEARLFDGSGDSLLPPFGGAFPIVSGRARREGGSRGATRQRLDGTASEAHLRTVDRALTTYLSLHPAPLVLVGATRTVSRFTALSRNLARHAGTVRGSHARTPLPTLVELIRPVLEEYLRSRQEEALALLEDRGRSGRVATGMPAVWLASRVERPEMLAVEEGLFYPARLSRDGDLLEPAADVEHPDVIDDAVDEVIETMLRRGGWIALVEDGRLAHADRIALSVRIG